MGEETFACTYRPFDLPGLGILDARQGGHFVQLFGRDAQRSFGAGHLAGLDGKRCREIAVRFVEQHFVSDVSAVFGNGGGPFETGIQTLIQVDRCVGRGGVELVAGLNIEIQILAILLTGGKPEGEGSCGEQHDIFQYGFHVFFLIG